MAVTLGNSAKRAAFHAASRAGVFSLVQDSAWRGRRLLILCYHGVARDDEDQWDPALYISPHIFAGRLALLQRHGCNVLPLDEGVRRMYAGTLPPRSVVLTFDDGYYDFYERVYPMLQAYGYPATVYLPTLRCEHNAPSFPVIASYLLWKRRGEILDLTGSGLPFGRLDLSTPRARLEALDILQRHVRDRRLSKQAKDDVAAHLAEALGLSYRAILERRTLTLMNPEEVATLAARGVDFQLHTHTHVTPRDRAECQKEIGRNREKLHEMTGRTPVHFCFPSGVYRRELLPWLREDGVETATTCDPGLASPASDPLLLSRFVDTCHVSELEFEGWLTGCAALLPRFPALLAGRPS